MKERINAILKHYKISASQFADEIGVQRASVSHVISERNKPGFDFIQKIIHTYPSISAEWLITGKGEMLKSKISDTDLFSEMEIADKKSTNDKKSEEKEVKSKASGKRNIEKIIVFYADKSFEEYFPE